MLVFLQLAGGISAIGGLTLAVQSNRDILALIAVMVGLIVYVGAARLEGRKR